MNTQSTTYTIIFMVIVAFAFVFLLSLTNEATSEAVAFNEKVARQRAILSAMSVEFGSDQEVLEKFENVEQIERDGTTLYRTTVDGETVYAKEFAGSGLWGTIRGVLGVNRGVSKTMGLQIISHNETPGLGGRIAETWFQRQFRGEQITEGTITFPEKGEGNFDHEDGEVDGITGATRTTESMARIVNREIDRLQSLIGGSEA
jgi:Na+-transporting NADH:ubiquinone oxidoreductase subunit C